VFAACVAIAPGEGDPDIEGHRPRRATLHRPVSHVRERQPSGRAHPVRNRNPISEQAESGE
jgi:hypothetical protein